MSPNPNRIQPSIEAFWYAERHTSDPRLKRIGLRGLFIGSLFDVSDSLGMTEHDKDLAVMAALQVVEHVRPSIIELCHAKGETLDWTEAEWFALTCQLADELRKDSQVHGICEGMIEEDAFNVFDRKPGTGAFVPPPRTTKGALGLVNFGMDFIEHMKGTDEYVSLFYDTRLFACRKRILHALYAL